MLVESGILGFGFWNSNFWNLELSPEIRNPAATGIRNSSSTDKESGVQNPQHGIHLDQRLSWITLYGPK